MQGLNAVALSPFQSTPPVRGATGITKAGTAPNVFQSTPPVRGATKGMLKADGNIQHFNPRPPCGGRLIRGYAVRRERGISIHAPRAGGDMR